MPRSPIGRPSKLNSIVERYDENGATHTVTVRDQLIADIRTGLPVMHACARAGITVETYYDWLKTGTRLKHQPPHKPGTTTTRALTRRERDLIRFSEDAKRAEAQGALRYLLTIADAATTKRVTTRTTTRTRRIGTEQTEVVETIIVSEEAPPDWRAALEIAQRRWPKEFGKVEQHEHSGPDGEPIPLALRIQQILERAERIDELTAGGDADIIDIQPKEITG